MIAKDCVTSTYGVQCPRILYGTAWKKSQTAALVRKAIQLGFRGIDTAGQPRHYHEPGVGAGIATCLRDGVLGRSDLYLQTKFTPLSGQDAKQVPYDSEARLSAQVAQSFESSLRNLQTHYVDCLVLHSPMPEAGQLKEAWQAMEAIFDAGGARQLGISNCYGLDYLEALCRSARIKPAVLQNRFHAETGYDRGMRAYCRQHDIIYQSFWTLTANPQVLAHGSLTGLASKHGRTPAQILFRYLTQEGVVPLTGTTSDVHMRQDLEIFGFELTDREREALGALF
ncbi:MAG TPA: aldo/keto reductase [Solimonas sp.]|nr:aldo/keto reductase [Solimonas sp.]